MRVKTIAMAAGLAAGLVLGAMAPAWGEGWAVRFEAQRAAEAGVDFRRVDWPTFCPSVEPVPLERKGRRCEVTHPASGVHRSPDAILLCDAELREYQTLTRPYGDRDPWHFCRNAWEIALSSRARSDKRGETSGALAAFRSRWFAGALVGGE